MSAFGYLLDPLTVTSLNIMVESKLSLWEFVRNDRHCKGLLMIYKVFKHKIDWSKVDEQSILKYVKINRPDLYPILNNGKGKVWLNRQIEECIDGLKKI